MLRVLLASLLPDLLVDEFECLAASIADDMTDAEWRRRIRPATEMTDAMLRAVDAAVFGNPSRSSLRYVYYRLTKIAPDAECLDKDYFKPLCTTLNWVAQGFPEVASTTMKHDKIMAWRPEYRVPEDGVQLGELYGYETEILKALEAPEKMRDHVRLRSIFWKALFIVVAGKGRYLTYNESNTTFSPGSGVRDTLSPPGRAAKL